MQETILTMRTQCLEARVKNLRISMQALEAANTKLGKTETGLIEPIKRDKPTGTRPPTKKGEKAEMSAKVEELLVVLQKRKDLTERLLSFARNYTDTCWRGRTTRKVDVDKFWESLTSYWLMPCQMLAKAILEYPDWVDWIKCWRLRSWCSGRRAAPANSHLN